MAPVDEWRYHAEVMIGVPDDPRGPRAARPHQLYEPGVPPDGAQAAGERAPEARGGTAAASVFGLRAARAGGTSARGAMACIILSVAVLVLALALLVRT